MVNSVNGDCLPEQTAKIGHDRAAYLLKSCAINCCYPQLEAVGLVLNQLVLHNF